MPATIIARSVTVSFADDGATILATKGDMWQTTDSNGNPIISPIHVGTQNSFTEAQLTAIFPQAALVAQVGSLQAQVSSLQAQVAAQPQPQPQPPTVDTVTALQGRLAINTVSGLRATVESAVAAADQKTKDFWQFATTWSRDNALLNALATQVGLTSQQVDGLFTLAKTL